MFLKHVADGFDTEFRRQVHDHEIFVIERLDGFGLLLHAPDMEYLEIVSLADFKTVDMPPATDKVPPVTPWR